MRLAPLIALGMLLASTVARADEPPAPRDKGFQAAFRTGAAVPFGSVSPTVSMSDALGVQVPFIVDLGVKVLPKLWIGAYLGVAVGNAAGQVRQACAAVAISCTGVGFRGGLMVQYQFKPAGRINPWIGYGVGYEIGGSSGSSDQNSVSNSIRGFEFGHLLGGADFRLQDYFGFGPFLDLSIGQYDYAKNEINSGGSVSILGGNLADKAFHSWLIIGVRLTPLP